MKFSCYFRLLAILALAVVIEGKLLHCTAEDAAITVGLSCASSGRPMESDLPSAPDCGDESGCICRGATLTTVLELEPPVNCENAVVFADTTIRESTASPFAPKFSSRTLTQPTGRRLRALLASFVI